MIEINLLPWRESRKHKVKKKQMIILMFLCLATFFSLIIVNFSIITCIAQQRKRNQSLKDEIAIVDLKLKEIHRLKSQINKFSSRLNFFHSLQNERLLILHLFDEISNIITGTSYINKLKRVREKVTIHGIAKSNNDVSLLMRKIEKNPWLRDPRLIKIKKKQKTSDHNFELSFIINTKEKVIS